MLYYLPTNQTLNTLVNNLGYKLKRVQKSKPLKKIAETDAIFENLKKVHNRLAEDDSVVRLSIDAKDRVKIGIFFRGGKTRVGTEAADYDFCDKSVTPFGIMDVKEGTVDISITPSKVTSDFIVDRIEEYWVDRGFKDGKDTLVLNADNGPENNSWRTQLIKKMVDEVQYYSLPRILPTISQERVWGALE